MLALTLISSPPSLALADELPPGIRSAQFLPGWTDEAGNRISAFEVTLEPGWKTYWRSPGDSGLPPSFEWTMSENIAEVQFHWPAPEVILTDGELTLGYHDQLILPFTARAETTGQPVKIAAEIMLGVCDDICVPVQLSLTAPAPDATPDRRIEAALSRQPKRVDLSLTCEVRSIEDGMQVTVNLSDTNADNTWVMELDGAPEIWVSQALTEAVPSGLRATSDFIAPTGKPFDLNTDRLRITRLGKAGATESIGCDEAS